VRLEPRLCVAKRIADGVGVERVCEIDRLIPAIDGNHARFVPPDRYFRDFRPRQRQASEQSPGNADGVIGDAQFAPAIAPRGERRGGRSR
jgi:hypothetical protein